MLFRIAPLLALGLAALAHGAVPTFLSVGPLLKDPLGYDEPALQFSWKLPEGRQTSWEIRCASSSALLPEAADLWSSGRRDSEQSLFVDYEGAPLGSRSLVYWTVRYWNAQGEASDWAPAASVELGLLRPSDWQGQWLSHPDHPAGQAWFAPLFRKSFEAGKVKAARLYFSAAGIVDVTLNGKRVNDHYFAPGWPDYRKRQLARAVDVTGLLREGENALGATLSDGWFSGNILFADRRRNGGTPRFLCQLEIVYGDGRREVIASDGSWKASSGPVVTADFYDGEVYDARLELPGWNEPGYDDSTWVAPATHPVDPVLPITPMAGPAVEAVEELAAARCWRSASGSLIYDFGVNLVGVPRLRFPAKAGEPITLRFAEALNPDGSPHYENLRGARATDVYTAASDGLTDWSPRFTFHGYRYLEVSGHSAALEPQLDWVSSLVLTSAHVSTGEFVSSVADWNQLQANTRRSQVGNFLEVPTDCPQRNERLGWTGDIQVFGPTAAFNFESLAFLEKWCRDLRDGQHLSGKIPEVAPDVMLGKPRPIGTPAWGDAIVIVPWDMYQKYGYKKILRDNFKAMIDWVAYYDMETSSNGGLWIDYGYGDWLQPFQQNEERPLRGDTSRSLLGTAYYARSASLLAQIAAVLGEDALAGPFARRAEVVRDRFAEAFFEAGRLKPRSDGMPTQTAYLLALAFDLLPEADRTVAVEELERLIVEEAQGHLRTGFVGTALICRTLTRFGKAELAYRVALQDAYPSWIYSIRQGATSIWERWNSYSKEEGFEGAKMNSLNHYAYGAVGQWMYESVAGLSELEPGYRRILVSPKLGGGLTQASATLETPYGVAASSWTAVDGNFELRVVTPPNTRATVELPDGSTREVEAGEHRFNCPIPSL